MIVGYCADADYRIATITTTTYKNHFFCEDSNKKLKKKMKRIMDTL